MENVEVVSLFPCGDLFRESMNRVRFFLVRGLELHGNGNHVGLFGIAQEVQAESRRDLDPHEALYEKGLCGHSR